MEVGAQGSVPLQPVFVVGLQPVDAAILEGKKGHGAVDLVVVFQTAHLVVLVQAVLQLWLQLIVGLVADAQHIHSVVFQLTAELPVVGGEVGRNKNKILHGFTIPLSSIKTPSVTASPCQLPPGGRRPSQSTLTALPAPPKGELICCKPSDASKLALRESWRVSA